MLAFLAVVVLGLAVWFLGPWLAFGAHHPLGDLSLRVTAIVMLVVLYVCWLRSWPYSPLAVAAVCVLLWHLGPLLCVWRGSSTGFLRYAHGLHRPDRDCLRGVVRRLASLARNAQQRGARQANLRFIR